MSAIPCTPARPIAAGPTSRPKVMWLISLRGRRGALWDMWYPSASMSTARCGSYKWRLVVGRFTSLVRCWFACFVTSVYVLLSDCSSSYMSLFVVWLEAKKKAKAMVTDLGLRLYVGTNEINGKATHRRLFCPCLLLLCNTGVCFQTSIWPYDVQTYRQFNHNELTTS